MAKTWIPVADLAVATDATTSALVRQPSKTRDDLDVRFVRPANLSPALAETLAANPAVKDAAAALAQSAQGIVPMQTLTNLIGNPALGTVQVDWNGNFAGGTGARTLETVGGPAPGVNFERATWATDATNRLNAGQYYPTTITAVPVTAGLPYSVSAKVRTSKSHRIQMQLQFFDASSVEMTAANGGVVRWAFITTPGVWHTTEREGVVAPVGATYVRIFAYQDYFQGDTDAEDFYRAGETHDMTQLMIIQAAKLPYKGFYFDGSSGGTAAWVGTVHRSMSTIKIPDKAPQSTAADLAQTSARVEQELSAEAALVQIARRSKGGRIGVGKRGVVALRFDDWHEAFRDTTLPLLRARGLPAALASISRLKEWTWSYNVTPAEVRAWTNYGIEIFSHGVDHKDPSLYGDAGLVEQIVTSKAEIEAWGVKVQGWMQPGATPRTPGVVPYGTDFTKISDIYATRAGRLLRGTYPIAEGYASGGIRNLPDGCYHGMTHTTISDGGITLAQIKIIIDDVCDNQVGVEFMTHAGNIGGTGKLSLADFTAVLDYITAKREAGLLEVLTPSGLYFADRSDERVQLLRDPSFEAAVIGSGAWTTFSGMTVESGGRGGGKLLRIPSAETRLASQAAGYLTTRGFGGEVFLLEGWARSNGAATTTARVKINAPAATIDLTLDTPNVGTGWTPIRHCFSVPVGSTGMTFEIGRAAGDGIDWDDVTIRKV